MKKQIIMPVMIILGLSFVAVGVVGYLYSQELILNGNQVEIDGLTTQTIPCDVGAECEGSDITIYNDLSMDALMYLDSNGDEEVNKKYVSTLTLTEKVVDFNADVWTIPTEAETLEVEYTIVGDSFEAEVIGEGKAGYVLVYYADNDNRFANPGEAVFLDDIEGNLPAIDDENADLNDYSLEYPTTPHGAKLWYVPETALTLGVIDWSRASEFLFETKLIQYNLEGQVTVYQGQTLVVTPVATIDAGEPAGVYTSSFDVARTA